MRIARRNRKPTINQINKRTMMRFILPIQFRLRYKATNDGGIVNISTIEYKLNQKRRLC
jgi:hypothetical protein